MVARAGSGSTVVIDEVGEFVSEVVRPVVVDRSASADFSVWMAGRGLTVRAAAKLLGVSKDSVQKYRDDPACVPRVVRLAIWALVNGSDV